MQVYFENKMSRAVLFDFPRKSLKGVYLFIHVAVVTQSLGLAGGVVTGQVVRPARSVAWLQAIHRG